MYRNRLAAFLVIFLLAFVVLVGRLACMQIVHNEYYEEIVERKRRRVRIFSGRRGTIYDCKGTVLAQDTQVFDASFILPKLDPLVVVRPRVCQAARVSEEQFNERLDMARLAAASEGRSIQTLLAEITSRAAARLRHLSEKYPEKYGALVVREMTVDGGAAWALDVDVEELCRRERTLQRASELLDISFERMLEKVEKVEQRVSGITNSYQRRYEMYLPYTLAKGISRERVEELEVRFRDYPGVVVTTRMQRVHPHGDLACHVLGYLRQLNREEYEELREQGRTIRRGFNELEDFERLGNNPFFIDDRVGATGVERVYDERLQGRKGARLLERDTRTPESKVLGEIAPEAGADLHLTIDAKVQRAAQDAFSQEGLVGAVVVMDVRTGGIIALASSPGYELDTFRKDRATFREHLEEPRPLLNRALCALVPGSGFKLVTAIAALEEGAITPGTHFY